MSAWIVSKAHIDIVVNAAVQHGLIQAKVNLTELGRELWEENHRSIDYRYNETNDRSDVKAYVFTATEATLEPARAAMAVDSYQYQTCEHPEWEASFARTLTTTLVLALRELFSVECRDLDCWSPASPQWAG